MAQAQTNGIMQMLDPFGFWKTYRDTSLDAWSRLMVEAVNSPTYTHLSGMILEQTLSVTQPIQDMVQKGMTQTLAYLNMPSREEVTTIAGRLVNVEIRLDDLDAKTSDMRDDSRDGFRAGERRMGKVEERVVASEETVAKEVRAVDRSLDRALAAITARLDGIESDEAIAKQVRAVDRSLDKALAAIMARLDRIEAAIAPPPAEAEAKAEPKPESKPEPKPAPKADANKK